MLLYGDSTVAQCHHLADAKILEFCFNQQTEQESFGTQVSDHSSSGNTQ
jgi:hypothetical protein